MKLLKGSILISVSLLVVLLPKKAARACGFYVAPGQYRFWLLQPDLSNQYNLTPFFFASGYLYRGDMRSAKETYFTQNVDEWFAQTNGAAAKTDVDTLLYHTDPQTYFDEPGKLAKANTLMRWLLQPENKELYRYMTLSKKVEQVAANPDPWEEDIIPQENISKVMKEAGQLQHDATSGFTKLRTAFQRIRLHVLQGQYDMAARLYDTWIEPSGSKSWIKSAALYQRALAASGPQKHYLLSKVFDRGDYNRTPCLVYFDSRQLDSILPLAKNQHEWNVLHAMKAFNYPGRSLDILKSIYETEPGYKDLPFLLLREINKTEDWLLTTRLTGFEYPAVYNGDFWSDWEKRDEYVANAAANYQKDLAYTTDLYQFINKVIAGKRNATPLLHLYAAHVCLLLKDHAASARHLELAAAAKNNDAKLATQIRINRLLLQLENGFDARAEKEFMSVVQLPDAATGLYDPGIMKNQLILYTARKLMQKGNKAKGLMLLSRTNRAIGELPIGQFKSVYQEIEETADEADYDQLLQILDKKNKTPFEKFITYGAFRSPYDNESWYEPDEEEKLYWDRNKLLDAKSSWYLRRHRLEESMEALNQVADSFYAREPYISYIAGNPFYVNTYSPHAVTASDKRTLGKKQVVAEMIRLQSLALKDTSKAAECYYQLANAWYNMTYHGKNWLMVTQWWSQSEPGYKPKAGAAFAKDYYGCAYAKSLYIKAIAATKDPKLEALCHYMVKVCDDNYSEYLEKPVNTFRKPRSKEVNDYYQTMLKECELYASFIKQYNRDLRF